MNSDNPPGGDNQQETASTKLALEPYWIAGFVDGEGCFSVSIHGNPFVRKTRGWQVVPVFQVSQHVQSKAILEALQLFFGCGKVRDKGPRSTVMVYAVGNRGDLLAHIVPFFEKYRLRVKDRDFRVFAEILRMMKAGRHQTPEGFERVIRLAYSMNMNGKQRARTVEEVLAGSSETARQAPLSCPD